MESESKISATAFLISWLLLVVLTFGLIYVGTSSMAAFPKVFLILGMMTIQAYLVAFYFMHLRFERLPLVLSVVLGIVLTAGLLYALIVWDGSRIIKLSVLL